MISFAKSTRWLDTVWRETMKTTGPDQRDCDECGKQIGNAPRVMSGWRGTPVYDDAVRK